MSAEGDELVEGKGCFTADIADGGASFAAFVRSDHAHATICRIDISAALAMPGVEAVLTGADCGPFGSFPAFLRQPTLDGRPLVVPHRPVFAGDRVRHVGELVAVVVASTQAVALEASELVGIEYDVRDVITGIASAAAQDAPLIHEDAPGNCAAEVAVGDTGAVATALDASTTVVELTLELPRLAPAPMENRAVVAAFDADAGVYDLWTPHQGIGEIRRDLAAVLAVPAGTIRVHAGHVGGAFGARGAAYPEHAALLAAARKTGRRLRWQATRVESFLSDYHGRGTRLTGRLGLDEKGRFTAIEVRFDADLGAYLNPVGAHINVSNPMQTLTGCYRIPHAAARFGLYFTNAVPIGPFRGAGRPDIAYLIERLVDEAAVRLKIDRLALRRRNVVPVSAFPYKTPAGAVYDSGDYLGLLARASLAADWKGFPKRRRASSKRGRLRGIGASLFVEVAGGGPVAHDEVSLRIDLEENRPVFVIETVSKNTGQGHVESYRRIVAERLGIEPGLVRLDESPADTRLVGAGSFASRSMAAVGEALNDACDKLALALRDVVAGRQGESGAALHVAGDAILRADGSTVAKLRDVLPEASRASPALAVIGKADVASTFPSGCHIAEVEIDPETGVTRVVSYVAVDDAGNVISPATVEGQIMGGIAQGVGSVLGERIVYDEGGQLVTSSFMDYAMPRADDLPSIEVLTLSCPSPRNRLGVKGVGEAGTTGAIPAVANAVIDALRARGASQLDIPLTSGKIWRAIRADT